MQHGKTQIRQFPTVWGCNTGRGYICLRGAEEVPFRLGMLEKALFSHFPKVQISGGLIFLGLGVGGRRAFGRLVFRQCTKIRFRPPTWWNIRPLLSSCRVLDPWDGGAEVGKAPQTLSSRSSGSSEGEGRIMATQ